MLKPYGIAELVGSVELDLIVKKDIDIHVLMPSGNPLKAALSISEPLLHDKAIDEIRITKYTQEQAAKIGIDDYAGESGLWSIDLWLTTNPQYICFDYIQNLKKSLTPKQRSLIMKGKKHFHEHRLFKAGISRKIYNAVSEKNIKTLDDLITYIKHTT